MFVCLFACSPHSVLVWITPWLQTAGLHKKIKVIFEEMATCLRTANYDFIWRQSLLFSVHQFLFQSPPLNNCSKEGGGKKHREKKKPGKKKCVDVIGGENVSLLVSMSLFLRSKNHIAFPRHKPISFSDVKFLP